MGLHREGNEHVISIDTPTRSSSFRWTRRMGATPSGSVHACAQAHRRSASRRTHTSTPSATYARADLSTRRSRRAMHRDGGKKVSAVCNTLRMFGTLQRIRSRAAFGTHHGRSPIARRAASASSSCRVVCASTNGSGGFGALRSRSYLHPSAEDHCATASIVQQPLGTFCANRHARQPTLVMPCLRRMCGAAAEVNEACVNVAGRRSRKCRTHGRA